jgi:predicted PurR-regulated permease PerM
MSPPAARVASCPLDGAERAAAADQPSGLPLAPTPAAAPGPAPATPPPIGTAPLPAAAGAAPRTAVTAVTPRATSAQKWLLVLAVLALIKFAKVLLLPITLAVVLSFVLAPPQRALRKAGLPDMAAAALLVGTLLVAVGVLGSFVAGPAAQWWDRAPATLRQLIDTVDRARSSLPGFEPPAAVAPPRRAAVVAPPPADPVHEKLASEGYTITRAVVSQLASLGASAAATIVLLLFLLGSQHWLLMRTVQAIPRTRARALLLCGLRQAEREIGLFLGTMGLINLGLGVATACAMAALGMPNPLLWGALAGLLNFMPYVGAVLMAGILLLAGVLTYGLTAMTAVPAAVFFAIHLVEGTLLTPWVLGRRLLLSPLSVSLSILLWAWLWGVAGALLAVPMLLALRTVAKRTRGLKIIAGYLEGQPPNAPSLRSLLRSRKRAAPAAARLSG